MKYRYEMASILTWIKNCDLVSDWQVSKLKNFLILETPVYNIITENVGYHKFYGCCLLKMLTALTNNVQWTSLLRPLPKIDNLFFTLLPEMRCGNCTSIQTKTNQCGSKFPVCYLWCHNCELFYSLGTPKSRLIYFKPILQITLQTII